MKIAINFTLHIYHDVAGVTVQMPHNWLIMDMSNVLKITLNVMKLRTRMHIHECPVSGQGEKGDHIYSFYMKH